MALDFPSSPTNGQVFGDYTYDSTAGGWRSSALEATGLPAGGTAGQTLTKNTSTNYDVSWGTLALANGGTGATTASAARTNLGVAALGDAGVPFRRAAGTASSSAGSYVAVTFPASRFTVAPIVNVTAVSQTINNVVVPWFSGSITSTGFSVGAFTLGGSHVAAGFHWNATQMTSGAAAG